jgi:uncharacterized protein
MGKIAFFLTAFVALAATSIAATADRPVRMDRQGNPDPATAPSFDCARARGFVETSICSNVALGYTDRSIDESYQRLLLHARPDARAAIRQEQRDWLRKRNSCAQRNYLETSLDAREAAVESKLALMDGVLRANVSRIGQCETTRIDFIGPRVEQVEGDPPDGTSIGYADGVWQVSYDREPGALKSRLDDPVRVCLVSTPSHCPPGDDRGRIYSATNLRTHVRWSMPDAEHMCGGA